MNDSVCHTPIPTIFARSSGLPPAAIAVVRISGPLAGDTLQRLAGKLPSPRRGSVRTLRDPRNGAHLDHALVLWFPGPATATGEDLAELNLHGGRAVVNAVLAALLREECLREARSADITRCAFANGRIAISDAAGLADFLVVATAATHRNNEV